MRRLILAVACCVLVALPALAQQPQSEPNVLEAIGGAVRGFFSRIFGSGDDQPEQAAPAEAVPQPAPPQVQIPGPEAASPASAAPSKGAPVERSVDRGLHEAIARGEYEAALKQIDKGANIEAKDAGAGASVLHFAVMKGRLPLIDLLVTRGADINSRTRNGTTPLHTAVAYSKLEVAEYLVARGADINAQSASGATPLALALAAKNEAIAARLRELGAR